MGTEQQLLIRVKNALKGADLTNNPDLSGLYGEYIAWNNSVAARINECAVLLQKKLKIEAVATAQQEPSLFEQLELLLCADRKLLLQLGELYDWEAPANIDFDVVEQLKSDAVSAGELRPLLAEFRRIARTDMVREKLALLREISRMDKDNQEWLTPLQEVENKHLSQLISAAQQCIIDKNYEQLEKIHDELQNSPWVVSVPAIVVEKVAKVISGYRESRRKQQAAGLLERINAAYGAFDSKELEIVLEEFQQFCGKSGYTPDETELIQLREAENYLNSELEHREQVAKAKNLVEEITRQFDASAPLEEIERNYIALQATGENIPDYIANRVLQYRQDTERDIRIKSVLRGCKIIGISAVIILILLSGGFWATQMYIEHKQYNLLMAEITKGDVDTASSILAGIESKYPRLAKRAKISSARAKLDHLLQEDSKRAADVRKLFAEIDELRKKEIPDPMIKSKLKSIEALARRESEKTRCKELAGEFDQAWAKYQRQLELNISDLSEKIRNSRNRVIAWIKKGDFGAAEAELKIFDGLVAKLNALPYLEPHMLAGYEKLLNSGIEMRRMLHSSSTAAGNIATASEKVQRAVNFNALNDAVKEIKGKLSADTPEPVRAKFERLNSDVDTFNAIVAHQKMILGTQERNKQKCLFFRDIAQYQEFSRKFAEVQKNMVNSMNRIVDSVNMVPSSVFQVKLPQGGYMEIYFKSKSLKRTGWDELKMERIDGKSVVIRRQSANSHNYVLKIGSDEYFGCRLTYPHVTDISNDKAVNDFKDARAWYLDLIDEVSDTFATAAPENIVITALQSIQKVCHDEKCAPFWKMYLSLQIMKNLDEAKVIDDIKLNEMHKAFAELYKNDDADWFFDKNQLRVIQKVINNFDWQYLEIIKNNFRENMELLNRIAAREFDCIGIRFNGRDQVFDQYKARSGEVWCLDENGENCYLVGVLQNGKIIWSKKDVAENRLLLTVSGSSTRELQQIMDDKAMAIRPVFWPRNIKGGNDK